MQANEQDFEPIMESDACFIIFVKSVMCFIDIYLLFTLICTIILCF